MNRLLLISISLLFLIVAVGSAAAANDLSDNVHANECLGKVHEDPILQVSSVSADECLGKVHEDPILQCPPEIAADGFGIPNGPRFIPYSRGNNTFNTSQTGNESNVGLNITPGMINKINQSNDFIPLMSNNPYDQSGRDIF